MSLFKPKSFSSVISSSVSVTDSELIIGSGDTVVLNGSICNSNFHVRGSSLTETNKSALVVGGFLQVKSITLCDLAVAEEGVIEADEITIEGTLAIKSGGKIIARNFIRYRTLEAENGAVILAKLEHLDHISAGETT